MSDHMEETEVPLQWCSIGIEETKYLSNLNAMKLSKYKRKILQCVQEGNIEHKINDLLIKLYQEIYCVHELHINELQHDMAKQRTLLAACIDLINRTEDENEVKEIAQTLKWGFESYFEHGDCRIDDILHKYMEHNCFCYGSTADSIDDLVRFWSDYVESYIEMKRNRNSKTMRRCMRCHRHYLEEKRKENDEIHPAMRKYYNDLKKDMDEKVKNIKKIFK